MAVVKYSVSLAQVWIMVTMSTDCQFYCQDVALVTASSLLILDGDGRSCAHPVWRYPVVPRVQTNHRGAADLLYGLLLASGNDAAAVLA